VAATPALYASDTGNDRVLGWQNAASFLNGAAADNVVGQPVPDNAAPGAVGIALCYGNVTSSIQDIPSTVILVQ
jgi:hypothetical protein